jgi:phosphodiesterase/alkaline phosphatase D-like protein
MVADTIDEDLILSHIGFGSCNNQNKGPQNELYQNLTKEQFDLWIWSGDVVYTVGFDLKDLEIAYEQLKRDGSYFTFAQTVPKVIGTWDDHDLGKCKRNLFIRDILAIHLSN